MTDAPDLSHADAPGFAPDIVIYTLLTATAKTQGAVEMGQQAEAFIRGIRMAVASVVGPHAALAVMRRAAIEAWDDMPEEA